jgi:hypothetical protein
MTRITQLPISTAVADNQLFVVVDAGTTKQLSWANIKATGIANTLTVGLVKAGSNILIDPDGTLRNSVSTFVSTGLAFTFSSPNSYGVINRTTYLTAATTSALGGVIIGDNINLNTSTHVISLNIGSTATLGLVKSGSNILIDPDGTLRNVVTNVASTGLAVTSSAPNGYGVITKSYYLKPATTGSLGGVIVGNNINLNTSTNVISISTGSTSTLGLVQIGRGIIANNSGVITADEIFYDDGTTATSVRVASTGVTITSNIGATYYTWTFNNQGIVFPSGLAQTTPWRGLSPATTATIGGVIPDGVTILVDSSGTISTPPSNYILPVASTATLGGVKIDNDSISINTSTNTIKANAAVKANTQFGISIESNITLDNIAVQMTQTGTEYLCQISTFGDPTSVAWQASVYRAGVRTGSLNSGTSLISGTWKSVSTSTLVFPADHAVVILNDNVSRSIYRITYVLTYAGTKGEGISIERLI